MPRLWPKGVKDLLTSALKEFAAARKREGKKLGEHLLQRLDGMEEIVDALNELFPSLLQAHMDKVKARLAEAIGNIDNDRLQQDLLCLFKNPMWMKSSAVCAPISPKCAALLPKARAAQVNVWIS